VSGLAVAEGAVLGEQDAGVAVPVLDPPCGYGVIGYCLSVCRVQGVEAVYRFGVCPPIKSCDSTATVG